MDIALKARCFLFISKKLGRDSTLSLSSTDYYYIIIIIIIIIISIFF